MSYRLITKAVLTITGATGATSEREVECRLYPAPKRDAAGLIHVDGADVSYRRTGGKGRGTADHRYMYATVKGASCFWAITEAEATALVGGIAKLTSVVEQPKPEAPTEPVAPAAPEAPEAPTADVKEVARRVKGEKAKA